MRTLFPLKSTHKLNTIPTNSSPSAIKIVHCICHRYPPSQFLSSLSSSYLSPTHLNTLLNSATQNQSSNHATQIHAQIITNGYISLSFLFNNLINLYAKCGHIEHSLTLFSTTHDGSKNVVTWSSLITQLSHHSRPFQAFVFFKEMGNAGFYPNQFTFSAILPACSDTMIFFHGEQIHSLILKHGYEFSVFVASALVDMYAKCFNMSSAQTLFDEMPERNLVSWNCMLVGFLHNELFAETIGFFKKIIRENLRPDQVSFSSVLSASAYMNIVEYGKQLHGVIFKYGLNSLAYVKNSLMDMYCKCGAFEDAVTLFQTIGDRDVVTWNVMIMGSVQNDDLEEACNSFWVMRREGVLPDEASFSSVLHATANLAALDQGTLIHNQIIKTGFEMNTCVTSSLITMYAKCGSLFNAQRAFEESGYRTVVSWTSMISAYQQHGNANRVIELFEKMVEEGIKPSYITFICVLSACSHTGLVKEGFGYFNSMLEIHNVIPGPEHYAAIVDLLGRAGRLHEAKKFAESMPIKANASVWGALLGACRNHGNLEMGREVAERLFEIEPFNPGNYLLLCDMFSHDGELEEANEVRRLMGVNGIRKQPGFSWIDVKNEAFVFTANDISHFRTNEIYEMLGKLEELVKTKDLVAETDFVINNMEEYN